NQAAATLLSSGQVLIAGGFGSTGALASAELYDPTSNSWNPAGNMSFSRFVPAARLLPNGQVLVAGGGSSGTILASAELFDPGLEFADRRRPVLTMLTDPVQIGTPVTLDGSGFTGDSEASGGATNNSATNYPLVQFHRLDNDQLTWLSPDPTVPFTATNWQSLSVTDLNPGTHAMTVFV